MKVADSRPASWPSVASSTSTREAAALGPALVHPQQHLGPVLGVGPAGPGVDLADGVALVVLAREQRLQLELADPPGRGRRRSRPAPWPGRRRARRPQPTRRPARAGPRRRRGRPAGRRTGRRRRPPDPSSVVTARARSGSSHRSGRPASALELGAPGPQVVDPEVRLGLGQPGGQLLESSAASPPTPCGRRVPAPQSAPSRSSARRARHARALQAAPWQSLNFFPLPHQHGSLRPTFSWGALTTGTSVSGSGAGS